jgi:hypothetical protein
MSKLVVVVGATGMQGGSVISRLLTDSSFKIRGTTSNSTSDAAKKLVSQGVEVVNIDVNDEASMLRAFEGAHVIFAITNFFKLFEASPAITAMEAEYNQGVNLAKAASKTPTLEHYIWSTLPYSAKLTKGRCMVPHFDGKARVDEFIKSDKKLSAITTFLFCGFYPTNINFPMMTPFYMVKDSPSAALPSNCELTLMLDRNLLNAMSRHSPLIRTRYPYTPLEMHVLMSEYGSMRS